MAGSEAIVHADEVRPDRIGHSPRHGIRAVEIAEHESAAVKVENARRRRYAALRPVMPDRHLRSREPRKEEVLDLHVLWIGTLRHLGVAREGPGGLLRSDGGIHRLLALGKQRHFGVHGGTCGHAFVLRPAPADARRSARHTRSGVNGISTASAPADARASRTALSTQGMPPTVPASPAPLTPSGFVEVGTGCRAMSQNLLLRHVVTDLPRRGSHARPPLRRLQGRRRNRFCRVQRECCHAGRLRSEPWLRLAVR